MVGGHHSALFEVAIPRDRQSIPSRPLQQTCTPLDDSIASMGKTLCVAVADSLGKVVVVGYLNVTSCLDCGTDCCGQKKAQAAVRQERHPQWVVDDCWSGSLEHGEYAKSVKD